MKLDKSGLATEESALALVHRHGACWVHYQARPSNSAEIYDSILERHHGDTSYTFANDGEFFHQLIETPKTIFEAGIANKGDANAFKGFIYAFYINMAYVATGDFPHKKANCDNDCSGLSCTSLLPIASQFRVR